MAEMWVVMMADAMAAMRVVSLVAWMVANLAVKMVDRLVELTVAWRVG